MYVYYLLMVLDIIIIDSFIILDKIDSSALDLIVLSPCALAIMGNVIMITHINSYVSNILVTKSLTFDNTLHNVYISNNLLSYN